MSQFDFPRINFHGQAFLDTPTANNGYIPNVFIFNQNESEVFMPPRIMFDPSACTPPAGATVYKDENGNSYINPLNITTDNFQQWCITPLGSFPADASYADFYKCIQTNGMCPFGMNPGYWNYYGDVSMSLQNVVITGITALNEQIIPITYTEANIDQCPASLAPLMGAELSFKDDYFTPGSRTTAFLCDVDSEGQLCTQIFYGQAGLYKIVNGENISFFQGHPVKSTVRFMNLFRVLNYANIVPMGGSASFYTTIEWDSNNSSFATFFPSRNNEAAAGIFIKLLIHEVHEVRNPDYGTMPVVNVTTVSGNKVQIPKNPASVSITGSITPYYSTDMKTTSICRILKNAPLETLTINTNGIDNPQPKGSNNPLGIPAQVNFAPVPFVINSSLNLISLDLSNMLHEYGLNPGTLPSYAGNGDIPPYQNFNSYNYGTFMLMFQPDNGGSPLTTGNITYDDYKMPQFIAAAGMVDLPVTPQYDYGSGSFYLSLNQQNFLLEDELYITTDQQGVYAEQSNTPTNVYLSDGLPRVPCVLRVFSRGIAVSSANAVVITVQGVNFLTGSMSTNTVQIYDGMEYSFPVNNDGCTTYVFPTNPYEKFPTAPGIQPFAYLAMNSTLIVCRVLSAEPQLSPYLNGTLPITWDIIFANVLQLYKMIYPIMDIILPITKETWSDPFIQDKILSLTDENNWNQPLFMPVTRDMSATQRQLLQMWVQQSKSSQTQKQLV